MKQLCIVLLSTFLLSYSKAQNISIDFSTTDTVSNMAGFLLSMNAIDPKDELITPLKPAYWRTADLNAMKARKNVGAQNIFLVSELYGYPASATWTASMQPFADTIRYKNFIDSICFATIGIPVIYDIWNEPDGESFWNASQTDFFRTFKIAHDEIRRNLGYEAKISGPSISRGADTSYIRSFCDYCLANNIQLDVLSFHWLYIQVDSIPVEKLADVLTWCRKSFIENAKYAPLKIKKIIVNEIVNEPLQHDPGFILTHFFFLEKGKADGSCKACWDDDYSRPYSNCWENTLDGLLSRDDAKRSSWWATKSYADLDSIRYKLIASPGPICAMSGNLSTNNNTIRVLVAYNDQNIATNNLASIINLNYLNQLPNFSSNDKIRVSVYKIENSGTNGFLEPLPIRRYWLDNINSSLSLLPVTLNPGEVIYADIIAASKISLSDNGSDAFPLVIFPNPSASSIYIANVDEAIGFDIKIFSSTGQLVYKSVNKVRIDINNFARGVYYLKLTQKGKSKIEKFIKN